MMPTVQYDTKGAFSEVFFLSRNIPTNHDINRNPAIDFTIYVIFKKVRHKFDMI